MKVDERVLFETRQIGPDTGWLRCRGRGQLTGRHQELIGICRVVLKLARPEGVGPGTKKGHGRIDRTQDQLLFFNQGFDRKLQERDCFEKRRPPFLQPLRPLGIAASLTRSDDVLRLEPDTDERMGVAKS